MKVRKRKNYEMNINEKNRHIDIYFQLKFSFSSKMGIIPVKLYFPDFIMVVIKVMKTCS